MVEEGGDYDLGGVHMIWTRTGRHKESPAEKPGLGREEVHSEVNHPEVNHPMGMRLTRW